MCQFRSCPNREMPVHVQTCRFKGVLDVLDVYQFKVQVGAGPAGSKGARLRNAGSLN